MVPVVHFTWFGREADWPVLGPMHTDADFFNFPARHYHVDIRFLNARTRRWAAGHLPESLMQVDPVVVVARCATGFPLNRRDRELPDGRPLLTRRRCFLSSTPFGFADDLYAPFQQLRDHYGDPAPAIAKPDGRLLCPHRKVDLSSFPPDAAGVVTCPLHGLRVRCAPVAA